MRVSLGNFLNHGLLIFPLFMRLLAEFIRQLHVYALITGKRTQRVNYRDLPARVHQQ